MRMNTNACSLTILLCINTVMMTVGCAHKATMPANATATGHMATRSSSGWHACGTTDGYCDAGQTVSPSGRVFVAPDPQPSPIVVSDGVARDAVTLANMMGYYTGVFTGDDVEGGYHGAGVGAGVRRLDPYGAFPTERGSVFGLDARAGVLGAMFFAPQLAQNDGVLEEESEMLPQLGLTGSAGLTWLDFTERDGDELTGWGLFGGARYVYWLPLLDEDIDILHVPGPMMGVEFPTYNRRTGTYSSMYVTAMFLNTSSTAVNVLMGGSF